MYLLGSAALDQLQTSCGPCAVRPSSASRFDVCISVSNAISPGPVGPRGLLVAALVLELPEDVPGSWAAESCAGCAPSAALSVVLVLGPLRDAGRPRTLPLAAGARLRRAACLVLGRTGGILMKEKQASHQQHFWSVIPIKFI